MSGDELRLLPAPRRLERTGTGPPTDAALEEHVVHDLGPEAYRLALDPRGARLEAGGARGLRYGRDTFEQIRTRSRAALPGLRIDDAPALADRGFMLDVSRDRVPTMETLCSLVETLARVRMNQLQLYTEHTFAYASHREVWEDASPLMPDEIAALDTHCASLGIELVPNQNSFGHMERWLAHDTYRPLAETREPTRGDRPPACLAPTDESARFVVGLYDELLPCFRSQRINIGCDETFELGRGRSRALCEELGTERVYLDFVTKLIATLGERGRSVQLWGDVLGRRPDVVRSLPAEVTALVWGYEAPVDPDALPPEVRERLEAFGVPVEWMRGFAPRVAPFADAGIPFYVCPGTSSWNSLVGRLSNARANVADAVRVGRETGAQGLLLTDWGDNGHLQPPLVSLPALIEAGCLAWCPETNADLDLRTALAESLGAPTTDALLELGELYSATSERALNASPIFWSLLRPLDRGLPTFGEPTREELAALGERIDALHDGIPVDKLVGRELRHAAALARHGARRHAARRRGESIPGSLRPLIDTQRSLWLERSRPGGLRESLARLEARAEEEEALGAG